jgi:hypothetical protein
MIRLPGEELNRRLEELSLKIERMSLLIEDALVDPAETISLERSQYNDLILCLSKYEELLNSFQETTEDTAEEIRSIVGQEECFCGEMDCDDEIDVPGEDEDTSR